MKSFLTQAKEHFAYSDWEGVNTLGEALFVKNHFIDDRLMDDFKLHRITTRHVSENLDVVSTVWVNKEDGPERAIRIDVGESNSRQSAHISLLKILSQCQSPNMRRRIQEDMGDIAFGSDESTMAVFTRANLTLLLASIGNSPTNTETIARQLDEAVISKPDNTAKIASVDDMRAQLGGTTAKFVESAVAGRRVEIQLELPQGSEEPPMLRFFSHGGNIFAEAGRLVFDSDTSADCAVTMFALPKSTRKARKARKTYKCLLE